MTKKILLSAAVLAAAAFQGYSQDTMYLIKGDHVVGKYGVDDVDYVSFTLPEGVVDSPVSVMVGEVGKNNITYTVSTTNPGVAYAHGIVSSYEAGLWAMDEGEIFEDLTDEGKIIYLKTALQYSSSGAFVGEGTKTYSMKDFEDDGDGGRFSVRPNTTYYVCAWEIDPDTQAPKDAFFYTETKTLEPGQSSANFQVSFVEQREQGAYFNFTGSDDILYVVTAYGPKENMDAFIEYYGADYLFGSFGGVWQLSYLNGSGEVGEGVPNSIWPVSDPGEYVMLARAYDANGDMVETRTECTLTTPESEGPEIKIYSKQKGNGSVSVNFEISPSNVEEAYVRMMDMNNVDDRLNMGYTLYELSCGGDATDITNEINTMGEYTFTSNEVGESWNSILIGAKDKDGGITALRLDFIDIEGSEWGEYNPVHKVAKKTVVKVKKSLNPTVAKVASK